MERPALPAFVMKTSVAAHRQVRRAFAFRPDGHRRRLAYKAHQIGRRRMGKLKLLVRRRD
jgi:hypothetical protein